MEQQSFAKKWFDNKGLLILLFFIMPPLGIYGMVKRNTITWKKYLYIISAILITTPTLIGVVGLIFIDNYKMGIDYYNEHDYERAYKNFEQVKSGNKNYADAITKMNEIRPIVDSLRISYCISIIFIA